MTSTASCLEYLMHQLLCMVSTRHSTTTQVPFCPHHACDVVSYFIICDQNEKFLFKPDPITAMLPPLSLMVLLFIDLEVFLSSLRVETRFCSDISDQVEDSALGMYLET